MVEKLNSVNVRNHLNLECIHDDLSYLSIEIPRKLKLLRELDIRVDDKKIKLANKQKRFLDTDAKDEALHQEIQALYQEIHSLAQEKVTIAKQCTAAIDRHVPVLKKEINNLDIYIVKDDQPSPRSNLRHSITGDYMSEGGSSRRPLRRHGRASQGYQAYHEGNTGSVSPRTHNSQMPGASYEDIQVTYPSSYPRYDQNMIQGTMGSLDGGTMIEEEKKYCICNQPASYDENMIACDNKNCQIEWFHVKCVLVDQPMPGADEQWECPICIENRQNSQ